MKNKKGFTLVELLAVIAILAILVLISMPNVLKLFNEAKKNSFITEVKTICKESGSKFVLDQLKNSSSASVNYCNVADSDTKSDCTGSNGPLEITGGNDISYLVKMNNKGEIELLQASNGTYNYEGSNVSSCAEIADKIGEATYIDNGMERLAISLSNSSSDTSVVTTKSLANDIALVGNGETEKELKALDMVFDCIKNAINGSNKCEYNKNDIVGARIPITLSIPKSQENGGGFESPKKFYMRVINISTSSECSKSEFSQSGCGIVLDFDEILTKIWVDGTYPAKGTRDSSFYNYVTTTLYNSLPAVLKNNIINTSITYEHISSDTDYIRQEKLFLLSPHEIYGEGTPGCTVRSERQLDYYYGNGGSTKVTKSSNLSRTIKKYNNVDYLWLIRSERAVPYTDFYFDYVFGSGYYGEDIMSEDYYGVSPSFRIG